MSPGSPQTSAVLRQTAVYPISGTSTHAEKNRAAISRKPTGTSKYFATDVVSISKKDLVPGEILDGEGGFCAHGEFFSADESLRKRAVPLGLSETMKIIRPVKKGQLITWDDVQFDAANEGVKLRRQMEEIFRKEKNL